MTVSGVNIVSEPIVFGVDIFPHYAKTGGVFSQVFYALAVGERGAIVRRLKVSRARLIHLIRSVKPSTIAVDNVFELAPDIDGLRTLFSVLPPETRVVQVTGSPKGAISLQDAAAKHGFKPPSRVLPMEEAEICVKLASRNVGSEVKVLGNETKILVSRDISLGPGGSSQSRYRRTIHTSILNATRNIERALKREGIDFDLSVEEADFGLERAVFTVYAPRTRLAGVVHSGHGHYIRVKVGPTYMDRVEFDSLDPTQPVSEASDHGKKLILGVDPGTTCGIAVIALDGTPLFVDSKRDLTRGEILRIVTGFGKPVIVAADVVNVPLFVKKLAMTLDSLVFTPETLLGAVEKQEIAEAYAEKYSLSLKDTHMRAAFTAAIKAFQHYRNKFEQVEAEVKKAGLHISVDEAKTLVVKGQSIQRALSSLSPPEMPVLISEPTPEKPLEIPEDDKVGALQRALSFSREQVKQLKETNEQLSGKVEALESQIASLREALMAERKAEMKEIRRDREYQILKREIEMLRGQLLHSRREAEEAQRPIPPTEYGRVYPHG